MTFQDLPLNDLLLKALAERGFNEPTEIQKEAIPLLSNEDTDFVGQAQTGTGKTLAFVLPLLNKIDLEEKDVQALILSPTRELANQINDEIKKFSSFVRIKTLSVYGGVPLDGQIRALKKDRPQIVVGTPGRVMDLIDRGVLKLENARFAVLDEADEMLDMGFIDDVKTILSEMGEQKKTWMFSATMPSAILNLIKTYLKEPKLVKIQKKTLSNANIEQRHYVVRSENMNEAICRLLDSLDEYYGMIFCRTKIDAKMLSDELNSRGYPSDSLHGDMSQQQRDITMKNFKNKKINMLVCTDVAARGIDVDNLTHVINYGLPQDIESYVHRIGRTGRAGQSGIALTLIEPSERYRLRQVENITKAQIVRGNLPTLNELKDVVVKKEVKKLQPLLENINQYETNAQFEEMFSALSKEDVLKVFFTHLFKTQIDRYESQPNLEFVERKPQNPRERNAAGSQGQVRRGGNTRFFVNMGREHGLTLKTLLNSVSNMLNVDERLIRNVDLKDSFSFLEIPENAADVLLKLDAPVIGNKSVRFEVTRNEGSSRGGDQSRSRSRFGGGGGGYRGGDRGERSYSSDRSSDRGGEFRKSRPFRS